MEDAHPVALPQSSIANPHSVEGAAWSQPLGRRRCWGSCRRRSLHLANNSNHGEKDFVGLIVSAQIYLDPRTNSDFLLRLVPVSVCAFFFASTLHPPRGGARTLGCSLRRSGQLGRAGPCSFARLAVRPVRVAVVGSGFVSPAPSEGCRLDAGSIDASVEAAEQQLELAALAGLC